MNKEIYIQCQKESILFTLRNSIFLRENIYGRARFTVFKVIDYNCHKNKIRTNETKNWQNNKNTDTQPKLSGSYEKSVYPFLLFIFLIVNRIIIKNKTKELFSPKVNS